MGKSEPTEPKDAAENPARPASGLLAAIPPALTGAMARQSSVSLAAKVFALACGFAYAVAVARILGPGGYGVVAVAMSVTSVAATLSLLGTNTLAVRETAAQAARGDWHGVRKFINWSTRTVLVSSLLLAAIVAAASAVPGPYRAAFLFAAMSAPLLAGILLMRGISQGLGRVVAAQLPLDVFRWLLVLFLIGGLLVAGEPASPVRILMIVLISFAVPLVIGYATLRRHLATVAPSATGPAVEHRWLAASLPFLGIALFGIVGTEINTVLLGMLAGPREAGLYQPLAKLTPLMMLAKEAIEVPLAPRLVSLASKGDRAGLARLLRQATLASTLATAALAGALLLVSPQLFAAFGPEFEDYRQYLYWIAAAQVLNAGLGSSPLLIAMVGNMKHRTWTQAATMMTQLALGIALVPPFGVPGAVIALSATIVVWSGLHWIVAWRTVGINTALFASGAPRHAGPQ